MEDYQFEYGRPLARCFDGRGSLPSTHKTSFRFLRNKVRFPKGCHLHQKRLLLCFLNSRCINYCLITLVSKVFWSVAIFNRYIPLLRVVISTSEVCSCFLINRPVIS